MCAFADMVAYFMAGFIAAFFTTISLEQVGVCVQQLTYLLHRNGANGVTSGNFNDEVAVLSFDAPVAILQLCVG